MLKYKSHLQLLIRLRQYSTRKSLIQLENATVQRFGAKQPVFQDLSLTIERGQQWVIVGPVNAGKTTLAETLAGRHTAQPLTSLQWPSQQDQSLYSADHVHLVSFKEDSGVFNYNQHYYQERFNFSDPDNDLTLRDYLGPHKLLDRIVQQLDLAHLLPLSFVKLSNGQTRRARIARALLRQPELLILDEPLMGLDVAHRKKLLDLLGELTKTTGVVLISRPQDEFPAWATDVLVLDSGKIAWQGPPEAYLETVQRDDVLKERQEKETYRAQALVKEEAGRIDRPGVVELNKVNVVYSGQKILDNVSWTVKQGDRWALLGPNGSGKTTLLSFLTGDHPQAYANDLSLFGRRRGTGESIWEIKAKVGMVSPELHLYFNQTMTGRTAAGTGFFDVVVPRTLDSTQTATVEALFDEFGVSDCLDRPLRDCSAAEQRLVLLIRSLVKRPPLLIWDEPFQGLDHTMILAVNKWLETYLQSDQTLILVTHHEDEIPRAVTRRFHLGPHGNPITP
ncbi:P-loop containing nucleoside triphosphate hydrolase protein [Chlamydoabsidia padenii]|nr:P-loop containing nucleoside triphosphate hydrolase protein [Chlamydoabsidia padenii]